MLLYFISLAIEFQSLIIYIRRIAFLLRECKFPFEIIDLYLNSTDYQIHLPSISIIICLLCLCRCAIVLYIHMNTCILALSHVTSGNMSFQAYSCILRALFPVRKVPFDKQKSSRNRSCHTLKTTSLQSILSKSILLKRKEKYSRAK